MASETRHRIATAPAGVRVRIVFNGELVADSREAILLEEAGHAPVYYLPRKDVKMERVIRTSHTTYCPHKGHATYYSLSNGRTARNAVWSYEQPYDSVAAIGSLLAFYPEHVSFEIGAAGAS